MLPLFTACKMIMNVNLIAEDDDPWWPDSLWAVPVNMNRLPSYSGAEEQQQETGPGPRIMKCKSGIWGERAPCVWRIVLRGVLN